ncbi:MAG: hypothetical protein RLZZ609_3099 [Cyanobacteriota bacterium]|jgi:hypothetical protein
MATGLSGRRPPMLRRRPSKLPQLPAHLEGIPGMVLIHQQDGQGCQHQGEHRQSWPGLGRLAPDRLAWAMALSHSRCRRLWNPTQSKSGGSGRGQRPQRSFGWPPSLLAMGLSRWVPSASHCWVSCSSQRRCPSPRSGGLLPMALLLAGVAIAWAGPGCCKTGPNSMGCDAPGWGRSGRHIAGALAGLLELLVRPMDLRLRGAGGVERAARIPVQEHVVAGVRGQRLGHGTAGHQCAGGRQARAELGSQRGSTD